MSKLVTIVRDISFFILFLVCSKHAFERSLVHMIEEKPSPWKKFDVHELDKGFLTALQVTQQQINQAISLVENKENNQEKKRLEDLYAQLKKIERQYKRNSPATYLLGPIGTTAIVLKEQRLEGELLEIIKEFGNLLYAFNEKTENGPKHNPEYKIEVSSIERGIIQNKDLLSQIPHGYVAS